MPKDDYSFAGGGALKLKGAKDAGVDKKRKKKKDKRKDGSKDGEEGIKKDLDEAGQDVGAAAKNALDDDAELSKDLDASSSGHKTEAELRHEEMRRRRLEDRMKREGFKTHKERVEELNKYLSTLSEHHDMPRIGPG